MMFKLRTLVVVLLLLVFAAPIFAQDAPPTVSLGESDELGQVLVGPNGMTLYSFDRDSLNESACYERCSEIWPPLIVRNADNLTSGEGVPGELGTIERTTGSLQVTYNGQPLYYWYEDYAAGDTNGQGVGGVWWVVPAATVSSQSVGELGKVLVDNQGMTLYIFANDEAGVSNCADECAVNWPPLTVESADALVANPLLPGELGTIERADGTLQVSYNGWPLYYWKDDAARGDATGQGVGDVWWVVEPETVRVSRNQDLGQFLVDSKGMTLYMFTNDTEGVSNCADECAVNWPPLTVANADLIGAGAGATGELGTIERADGTLQVTYNGMPLYYWKDDAAPGDTTGQGVGDVWFVVPPASE
jgi:predicted lipoprotein with Yx(FWY)xxD motif